ncbi:MAG: hypothetical protein V1848_00440 [Candidatus Magasanikbacteria bacterium]
MSFISKLMFVFTILSTLVFTSCQFEDSQEAKDRQIVNKQQSQYAKGQPIPSFDWSLERDLVIKLYEIRNQRVATHSVWHADMGSILYDCPSMGYGIPYDTSLTNPLMATSEDETGDSRSQGALTSIGQPEPNGVFASTNTSATWVMCVDAGGQINPIYVEAKVMVFPFPVTVDYEKNRITRTGKSSVSMKVEKPKDQ